MAKYKFTCSNCKQEKESSWKHTHLCSPECRKQFYLSQLEVHSHYPKLPTGTVGAISELRVSSDLLAKGFEVFRSLTPNSSCDLAILKNGTLRRVEVRTGYEAKNGRVYTVRDNRADVLAIVLPDKIVYEPELGI